MKLLSIFFVMASIMVLSTQVRANKLLETPVKKKDGTRIEIVDNYAFFVLSLEKLNVSIGHGDKVELVFGLNTKITLYNVSSENNNVFTNENELVVFISADDLRCFKKKTLRKVIICTKSETVVIKTNIGPDQLKIK